MCSLHTIEWQPMTPSRGPGMPIPAAEGADWLDGRCSTVHRSKRQFARAENVASSRPFRISNCAAFRRLSFTREQSRLLIGFRGIELDRRIPTGTAFSLHVLTNELRHCLEWPNAHLNCSACANDGINLFSMKF
jgi:hypothetical protein